MLNQSRPRQPSPLGGLLLRTVLAALGVGVGVAGLLTLGVFGLAMVG